MSSIPNPNSVYNFRPPPPPATMSLPQVTPQQAAYLTNLKHAQEVIPQREASLLGGYEFDARNVRFATQNPRERVFVMLRAHPITNLGWIFRNVIWLILPLILVAVLTATGFNFDALPLPVELTSGGLLGRALAVAAIAYYSTILTNMLINFLRWYFNMYLITNERIVNYQFSPLVSYNIEEARLENIENVQEKSVGFIPSIFQYGDIFVQTAAKSSELEFVSVPRPSKVRDIIADLSNFARRIYGPAYRE